MTLIELAERCEKATGPDRELDYAVVKAVGYANDRPYSDEDAWRMPGHFTASLDAAMTLVPEGWLWTMDSWSESGWGAGIWKNRTWAINESKGRQSKTPALALCAAALRARALK